MSSRACGDLAVPLCTALHFRCVRATVYHPMSVVLRVSEGVPRDISGLRSTLISQAVLLTRGQPECVTPNLPTKIAPTKICRLKTSGKFPMDMRSATLKIKILLESNPPKSRILARSLAAYLPVAERPSAARRGGDQNIYIYIYYTLYIYICIYIYIYA